MNSDDRRTAQEFVRALKADAAQAREDGDWDRAEKDQTQADALVAALAKS